MTSSFPSPASHAPSTTAPIFIAHTDDDKPLVRQAKSWTLRLTKLRAFRRRWPDMRQLKPRDVYVDEDHYDAEQSLAGFGTSSAAASLLVVVVPRMGLDDHSYARKELLAFLTGIVHAERTTPDPASLTDAQRARAEARIKDVLLVDRYGALHWDDIGVSGLGAIARTGCLAPLFKTERPRLRNTAAEPRRIGATALAYLLDVSPEEVYSVDRAVRRRSAMARGLVAAALVGLVIAVFVIERELTTTDAVADRQSTLFEIQTGIRDAAGLSRRAWHEWEGRAQLVAMRSRLIRANVARAGAEELEYRMWARLDQAILSSHHGLRIQVDKSARGKLIAAKLVAKDSVLAVLESFGDGDAILHLKDARNGLSLFELRGDFKSFAPLDESRYVVVTDDGVAVMRDDNGKLGFQRVMVPHGSSTRWVSEDGKRLVQFWPDGDGAAFEFVSSPDGKILQRGTVEDTPVEVVMSEKLPALYVRIQGDPRIRMWDSQHKRWRVTDYLAGPRGIASAPDGQSLIVVGENFVPKVFDAALKYKQELPDDMYAVKSISVFPSAPSYLLTVGGRIRGLNIVTADCAVFIWARASIGTRAYRSFPIESMDCNPTPAVAVASANTRFVYGKIGAPLHVYDAQGPQPIASLDHLAELAPGTSDLVSLSLSHDGSSVVITTADRAAVIDLPPYATPGSVDAALELLCQRLDARGSHPGCK